MGLKRRKTSQKRRFWPSNRQNRENKNRNVVKSRSRKRIRTQQDALGRSLIIGCVGFLVAVLAYAVCESSRAGDCLQKPSTQVQVLIDPLVFAGTNQVRMIAARDQVMHITESLPEGSTITVYGMSRRRLNTLERHYHHCFVGRPDRNVFLSRLFGTNTESDWEGAREELQRALDGLLLGKTARSSRSPILELVSQMQDSIRTEVPRREIILVSDMVQNSSKWSLFWRNGLRFDNLVRSPQYKEINRRRLGSVKVTVVQLQASARRDSRIQADRRFVTFWGNFFIDQGVQTGDRRCITELGRLCPNSKMR